MHSYLVLSLLVVSLACAHAVSMGRPHGGHGRGGGRMHAHRLGGRAHRYMCSMTDSSGQSVQHPQSQYVQSQGDCPSASNCSVGPLSVSVGSTAYSVMFCNVKDRNGNLAILRGACRMLLADGREIQRGRYAQEHCTDGPIEGNIKYFGQTAQVYFTNHNVLAGAHHGVNHHSGK